MEDRMQDVYKVALSPVDEPGSQKQNDALRRALNMRYVRTGGYVDGGLGAEPVSLNAKQTGTYRGYDLGKAALSQVRFGAQRGNSR